MHGKKMKMAKRAIIYIYLYYKENQFETISLCTKSVEKTWTQQEMTNVLFFCVIHSFTWLYQDKKK